jgi:hypothetical protein
VPTAHGATIQDTWTVAIHVDQVIVPGLAIEPVPASSAEEEAIDIDQWTRLVELYDARR